MKNYFKILLASVVILTFSFKTKEPKVINVVIDVSHGGTDFGSTNSDVNEKSIVAAISKKIELHNSDNNVKINLTRIGDYELSLKERVEIINHIKPDLVLSLHINANKNEKANGYDIFISDKSTTYLKSNELAEKFVTSFSDKSKLIYRGIKTAPLFILKNSDCPALLLELGFLTNDFDRNYVSSENGQTEIAQSILTFISSLKE